MPNADGTETELEKMIRLAAKPKRPISFFGLDGDSSSSDTGSSDTGSSDTGSSDTGGGSLADIGIDTSALSDYGVTDATVASAQDNAAAAADAPAPTQDSAPPPSQYVTGVVPEPTAPPVSPIAGIFPSFDPDIDAVIKDGIEHPRGFDRETDKDGNTAFSKQDDNGNKVFSIPGKDGLFTGDKVREEFEAKVREAQKSWADTAGSKGTAAQALGVPFGGPIGIFIQSLFGKTQEEIDKAVEKEIAKYTVEEMASKLSNYNPSATKNQEPTESSGMSENRQDGPSYTDTPEVPAAPVAPESAIPINPVAIPTYNNEAERARIQSILNTYDPTGAKKVDNYSPLDISAAKSPEQAEAMRQYNNLIALGAKQQVIADKSTAALGDASKVEDAWSKYYTPNEYKSIAARADAARAGQTIVGPASTISGNYQGDLSQLAGYQSGIRTSDTRQNAVDAMNMTQRRAQGLAPSVAEMSYRQSLDALAAQQASAQASQRGPGQAAGQEALMRQAASMGQSAVSQIAIAKAQEQQAAESAYAAQANQIMIEDQKVATAEKVNELSQLVNLTQGKLQNARNILDADQFNANAVNKVNELQATLSQQTSALNAQLANSVNIQNASMQNQTALANAANALAASQWAGQQSQKVSDLKALTERSDIEAINKYQTQAVETSGSAFNKAGTAATTISGQNLNTFIAEKQLDDLQMRYNIGREDAKAAAAAMQKYGETEAIVQAIAAAARDESKNGTLKDTLRSMGLPI